MASQPNIRINSPLLTKKKSSALWMPRWEWHFSRNGCAIVWRWLHFRQLEFPAHCAQVCSKWQVPDRHKELLAQPTQVTFCGRLHFFLQDSVLSSHAVSLCLARTLWQFSVSASAATELCTSQWWLQGPPTGQERYAARFSSNYPPCQLSGTPPLPHSESVSTPRASRANGPRLHPCD